MVGLQLEIRQSTLILEIAEKFYPEAEMTAGIVLIIAGVLLVLFPPLLSIIVASLLIFTGVLVVVIARNERRLQRHYQNPAIEFFFRH